MSGEVQELDQQIGIVDEDLQAVEPGLNHIAGGVRIVRDRPAYLALPMAVYAIRELGGHDLSHLLLMGPDFTGTPLEPLMGDGVFRHFRPIFRGTLIANVTMTAERGNRLIAEGSPARSHSGGRAHVQGWDLFCNKAAPKGGDIQHTVH